jgi:putative intracellular protease/amidase
MAHELAGKKVAILAADGVERVELEQPRGALYGAGAMTELLSIHEGEIQARQHDLVSAGTFPVDKQVSDASVEDYDALLLPGGTVNPDQLRLAHLDKVEAAGERRSPLDGERAVQPDGGMGGGDRGRDAAGEDRLALGR